MSLSLRDAFREKRTTEGLGLRAIEKQTGVSFSTLSRFERGHETTAQNRDIIAAWVNGLPITRKNVKSDEALITYLRGLGFVWRKP